MPGAEKIHRMVQQGKHLVAPLNAAGVVFNFCAAQICAGQVDRLQKILDTAPILHFKLLFQLLDGQFQAPHHIPVLFNRRQVSW